MQQSEIEQLMYLLANTSINGYDYNYEEEKPKHSYKPEYLALMRKYARELVKLLEPSIGTGKVHVNVSGMAGSGDVSVRFDTLYILFNQFALAGRDSAGYYRAEGNGLPFGYGQNHNIIVEILRYPRELANIILLNTDSERRKVIEKRALA